MKRAEGKFPRLSAFALAITAGFALAPGMVSAQDDMAPPADSGGGGETTGSLFGMSAAFSGFVRLEAAYRLSDGENPNNLQGNPFNGRPTGRLANLPIRNQVGNLLPGGLGTVTDELAGIATGLINSLGGDQLGIPSVATRNTKAADNDWSLQQMRGKFDMNLQITSDLQMYASLRTIYDFGQYDNFERDEVSFTDATSAGADADPDGFNYRKTRFFEYDGFDKGGCLNYLEVCGNHYMADFTALYFDYQTGPILIRLGQQQIAWGQALFFRVFDVPNGLDLRRHLILDDALEEYADERVAAPGLRVTWQATDNWELDGYAQLFVPTTYPNPNTPYNAIPAQFTIHESWTNEHSCSKGDCDFNYGLRARANFGNWGLQFAATRRWNHEGVFRWYRSGADDKDVPSLGNLVFPGSREAVSNTPLEIDPTGVWSANEWFTYAGAVRLDGLEGLNTLIREFAGNQPPGAFFVEGAGAASLFATEVDDIQNAAQELDMFFFLAGGGADGALNGGGLRGHLIHEYFHENVFAAGASYVVEAEPGSLLDQLIINLETSYIPDRKFTEKSLSRNYIESDESVSALVMEKYHRFSETFPATYLVFQAIHKTESDLFGRHLGCQGGTGGGVSPIAAANNPDTKQCKPMKNGHTDVVLAFLQPFPNYIYRASGAVLVDPRGGVLSQLGFRWSPGNDWTLDFLWNNLWGDAWGDPNENIIQTISWSDEFAVRIGYQF